MSLVLMAGLLATATAGELDVRWSAEPSGETGAVTWLEVSAGPLPPLEVPGPEGQAYRVQVSLTPEEGEKLRLDAKVYEVRTKKNGTRKLILISSPSILTTDGEEAMIKWGSTASSMELAFLPRLSAVAELRLDEAAAKEAEAAAAAASKAEAAAEAPIEEGAEAAPAETGEEAPAAEGSEAQ